MPLCHQPDRQWTIFALPSDFPDHMGAVRALSRRTARLERAGKLRPSPIVLMFGSFDEFVERQIYPGIDGGALDRRDMIEVVAALRNWEQDGIWQRAVAG